MTISLPDPLRDDVQHRIDSGHDASASDHVRDLIRREQSGIADEERWLHDLDPACDAFIADLHTSVTATRQ